MAVATVAAVLSATPGAADEVVAPAPSGQASILAGVGFDQRLDVPLPLDLAFRDERGERVTLDEYFFERPVVLALVYYQCPMLCTQVLNGLTQSLAALEFDAGEEFDVLVVSFDPTETPDLAASKKAAYLRRYDRPGAEAGWHFLTGDRASIERLTETVGFRYRYDERSKQYAHASGAIVLTPEGRTSRYFYGIDFPTRDLRLGLVEASAGRIGSPVDQILLLCFHYDPATGRYGLAIHRVMRVACAVTVLGLAGFIALSLRRERRRRRKNALVTAGELIQGDRI